jgi:sulfur carrier protein
VTLVVNGEQRLYPDEVSLREVLGDAGVTGSRGVAVAINGDVVLRSEWDTRTLSENDRVEILRAVGGG